MVELAGMRGGVKTQTRKITFYVRPKGSKKRKRVSFIARR